MKKLISILQIYALVAAMCSPALASKSTRVIADSYEGGVNILKDPGFESGTTNNVTISGGATATVNTTAKGTGSYGMDWDSNAAGQTATGVAITIPEGLKGKNAVLSCNIKTVSGTATHTLAAFDGTTAINPTTIASSAGNWLRTSVNFIMPSSGTITWQTKSVASNEPEIYVDDCILEDAAFFNLSQVSQAQLIGSISYYNCSGPWLHSSTTPVLASAVTGCTVTTSGVISAPSTFLPGFKINSAAPGTYRVVYVGLADNSTNAGVNQYYLCNGSNANCANVNAPAAYNAAGMIVNTVYGNNSQVGNSTLEWLWNQSTAASNLELDVYASASTGSAQIYGGGIGSSSPGTFMVYYFPSQSQTGYKPDQTPASWSGTHNSITAGCASTGLTYADPSACTGIVLNPITVRNVTCTTTSGSLPGIDCVLPRGGMWTVCAYPNVENGSAANLWVRLMSGATALNPGVGTTVNNGKVTIPVCGKYNASSSGTSTFKLQFATNTGTIDLSPQAALPTGTAEILWTVDEGDAPMAAPYLTGSVTSNTSGQERIEHADINLNGSTCSVNSQSGTWLTAAARPSSRRCTLTVASGIFSSANYHCTCSASTGASGSCGLAQDTVTKTATTFQILTDTTLLDNPFSIICMGPR